MIKPDHNGMTWSNIGALLVQLDRCEEAIVPIQKALEAEPDNQKLKDFLEALKTELAKSKKEKS